MDKVVGVDSKSQLPAAAVILAAAAEAGAGYDWTFGLQVRYEYNY